MGLTNEHVGPKILAKIKKYVLTRAELLFQVCYEIPCTSIIYSSNIFLQIVFTTLPPYTDYGHPMNQWSSVSEKLGRCGRQNYVLVHDFDLLPYFILLVFGFDISNEHTYTNQCWTISWFIACVSSVKTIGQGTPGSIGNKSSNFMSKSFFVKSKVWRQVPTRNCSLLPSPRFAKFWFFQGTPGIHSRGVWLHNLRSIIKYQTCTSLPDNMTNFHLVFGANFSLGTDSWWNKSILWPYTHDLRSSKFRHGFGWKSIYCM